MRDLLDGAGPMRLKKCRRGHMLYSINDVTIGKSLDLYGEFSEPEIELFEHFIRPGAIVVEAGANIGAHTVALARIVGPQGRVIAFEPQMVLFQTLCANVALNGFTNVSTFNAAVGATPGVVDLPRIDYDRPGLFGGHGIGSGTGGGQASRIRLDDFVRLNRCDFFKVDVEGMESDVLRGAAALIAKFKPVLYVENDRQDKSPELIRTVQGFGYALYWHLPPLYRADNFFGCADNAFERIVSINMLCVPPGISPGGYGGRQISGPED